MCHRDGKRSDIKLLIGGAKEHVGNGKDSTMNHSLVNSSMLLSEC